MKDLIYKEITFSINKFYYVFPLLLSLLLFIPNWIFSIVYMYFFWISASQIIVAYTTQADYEFLSMLPVTKKAIVTSKIIAFISVEMVHLILLLIFGIIHNSLYGSYNFFMNINPAFFGIALFTYGLFNLIFMPQYFKTAYRYGKPVIYAIAITLVFVGFFEYAAVGIPVVRDFIKSNDNLIQFGILLIGLFSFIGFNILTAKLSTNNFENIK